MFQTLTRRGLLMLLGACAIFVAAAGVAWAAIPGSTGAVNGCYGTQNGSLRVIDSEAGEDCHNSETPISWNQVGPKGDPGIPGPQGDRGPQGVPGPQGLPGSSDVRVYFGNTTEVIAGHKQSVAACPAGRFATGGGYSSSGGWGALSTVRVLSQTPGLSVEHPTSISANARHAVWTVTAHQFGTGTDWDVRAYVFCVAM